MSRPGCVYSRAVVVKRTTHHSTGGTNWGQPGRRGLFLKGWHCPRQQGIGHRASGLSTVFLCTGWEERMKWAAKSWKLLSGRGGNRTATMLSLFRQVLWFVCRMIWNGKGGIIGRWKDERGREEWGLLVMEPDVLTGEYKEGVIITGEMTSRWHFRPRSTGEPFFSLISLYFYPGSH